MLDLPQHKVIQISDCGIFLKEISPSSTKEEPLKYAHQDDYYLFGLIDEGTCTASLDFKEYQLSKGEVLCVQPGQVHSSIHSTDLKAFFLVVDSLFVSDIDRHAIDEYALTDLPVWANLQQLSELRLLFSVLSNRMNNIENEVSKEIIRNVSSSIVGIIIEVMQSTNYSRSKVKRHVEITLKFRELLLHEVHKNRTPLHYAASLNLSQVYLNEVVKAVTGMNVTQYIQNEIVLKAKRLLFYTHKNVQQIAEELGFEDYAYFTKVFTKTTGISPTQFRKKYLE